MTRNGKNIFGTAAMSGVRRAADMELAAIARWTTRAAARSMLRLKFQPSSRLKSFPIAYIEMPDEKIVITANEIALNPRVFSSKRSLRYSGTERAREP